MIKLIDSHAHLTSPILIPDLENIINRSFNSGVRTIINICTDLPSLESGIDLSKKHSWIHQAAATTPHDVEKEGEEVFDIIAKAARDGLLVAVGETGLDYYYEHSNRDVQKDFLRRYLHLAIECQLPVIIHCREAFADFFEILDKEYQNYGKYYPGVVHCFTGTMDEAEEIIKRGWYLSLSGIVTFKKSLELQEVARKVPLDQLLIETDAPYLAPQSHRGKTNEPAFLLDTAKFIAGLRNISVEEIATATTQNATRLFHL